MVSAFGLMRVPDRKERGSLVVSVAFCDGKLSVELKHILLPIHQFLDI